MYKFRCDILSLKDQNSVTESSKSILVFPKKKKKPAATQCVGAARGMIMRAVIPAHVKGREEKSSRPAAAA